MIMTDPTVTLGGTVTVPVVDGVATFSGLTLNQVGYFGLQVSATDMAPVDNQRLQRDGGRDCREACGLDPTW